VWSKEMSVPTSMLLSKLTAAGYAFFSGVPCSNFGDLFDRVADAPAFLNVPAANEGSAVALAAGAVLSGRRSVVALQNSGLGNIINPLTSLLMVNEIPLLLLISVRGHPDEPADEPQHAFMGAKTASLLDQLQIEWCEFDGTEASLDRALARAEEAFRHAAPFALLFRKGQLTSCKTASRAANESDYGISIAQAIELVCRPLASDSLVVSTTGYISRELFRLRDRPQNFYMQGSLGHCSAVAAGLAIASPARAVLALDGDGAVLMHMGILSTIGYMSPPNLFHVVLDNESYTSTGGQLSTSRTSSLDVAASSCGYRTATRCLNGQEITAVMQRCLSEPGPHFVLCKVNRSHPSQLPRVTSRHSPIENKELFQQSLGIRAAQTEMTE
jgi:phosphonopyruvate decarboxylase